MPDRENNKPETSPPREPDGDAHLDAAPTARDVLPVGYTLHWYEFGEPIGRGGFGISYAGRDTNLDQPIVIKEYFPQGCATRDVSDSVAPHGEESEETYEWGLRRFLEEAQTLAKFRHPAIVRVSGVFEANGTAYMVMDHVPGNSLADLIKAGSIDDEEKLLAILAPLLIGLEQVHAAGFIHRDVKPANIVITDEGSPVLLDFGAARQAMGARHGQLTTVGTRSYAPFEQFDGSGELKQGPWTDIYSLGAVLYEIVTGERPADALQRGTALLEGGNDPLRRLDGDGVTERWSAELLGAIEHALTFKVADRPESISAWRTTDPVLGAGAESSDPRPPQPEAEPAPDPSRAPADQPAPSRGADTEPHPARFSSLAAMVVDDEEFERNMAKRVLGRVGIEEVTTATDGEAALEVLEATETSPDVILCDLKMSGMDGLEFLRRLGERAGTSALILVSGMDKAVLETAQSLARAHGLRILGALPKPIRPAPLASLLARLEQPDSMGSEAEVYQITEKELDDALAGGEVFAVFQPIVRLGAREVAGVEALARLNHPTRGTLGPGSFVPLAEDSGRMEELTEAILRSAAVKMAVWRADGIDLSLSVNVCADSLADTSFADRLIGWAAAEGLDPARIVIEVTETRMMQEMRSSLETLSRFRLNGVGLAIDDFGTGYSSLKQLRNAPFTDLKIDRQFVSSSAKQLTARAICKSSVSLAQQLGLQVTAEGVETREDLEFLEGLGCDKAQGYFLARPMPGEEIPNWIEDWTHAS